MTQTRVQWVGIPLRLNSYPTATCSSQSDKTWQCRPRAEKLWHLSTFSWWHLATKRHTCKKTAERVRHRANMYMEVKFANSSLSSGKKTYRHLSWQLAVRFSQSASSATWRLLTRSYCFCPPPRQMLSYLCSGGGRIPPSNLRNGFWVFPPDLTSGTRLSRQLTARVCVLQIRVLICWSGCQLTYEIHINHMWRALHIHNMINININIIMLTFVDVWNHILIQVWIVVPVVRNQQSRPTYYLARFYVVVGIVSVTAHICVLYNDNFKLMMVSGGCV